MVMAVTGVVMIVFLLGHLAGNLLVFRGAVQLDEYSALLHFEPPALWAARANLLVAVTLHIIAACQLALSDRAARRDADGRWPAPRKLRQFEVESVAGKGDGQ
jgi:succinate dehydrogenase / fumarate reductase cytochrome b subunit